MADLQACRVDRATPTLAKASKEKIAMTLRSGMTIIACCAQIASHKKARLGVCAVWREAILCHQRSALCKKANGSLARIWRSSATSRESAFRLPRFGGLESGEVNGEDRGHEHLNLRYAPEVCVGLSMAARIRFSQHVVEHTL